MNCIGLFAAPREIYYNIYDLDPRRLELTNYYNQVNPKLSVEIGFEFLLSC